MAEQETLQPWKVKDLKAFLENLNPETPLFLEGRFIYEGQFYIGKLDDGVEYVQLN